MSSVYTGIRDAEGRTFVDVDGRPLALRADARHESSTAFDWGYQGRGAPAQLALAILADHFADDHMARRHFERFLSKVVGLLPRQGWRMTGSDIDGALAEAVRG